MFPRALALTGFALALATARATAGYPDEIREVTITSSADSLEQPALFFAPEGVENAPLMVALHTWSSDWKSGYNVPLAEGCIERGWAFLHPDFRGPNNRPAACGSELAVADIRDAVAWALKEAKLDPERVYLAGASGGGHMSLLMAGRAPELWAGVSSWVPISDCAAWHAECIESGRRYANDLVLSCGGKPGDSAAVDAEYKQRSPLTWLAAAKGIPVSINAGIRDGHDGSVPISQSLLAYNVLADKERRIAAADIDHFTRTATVPDTLEGEAVAVPAFGEKQPLWQRSAGKASVTIFNGGHEMVPAVIFEYFEGKRR